MIVLIKATKTSIYKAHEFVDVTDVKINILLKKPAKGGIPARENMANVMANESHGLVLWRPL